MLAEPGLRDRKKQQTRQLIAETSMRLFACSGLESVTQSLAKVIAEETGKPPDDSEARVAVNALMGVHRAMLSHARRRALDGSPATI
jgi:uncharacterized metal-binding protein